MELFHLLRGWLFACVNHQDGLGSVQPGASAAPLDALRSPVCGADETGREKHSGTLSTASKRWPVCCVTALCCCLCQIKQTSFASRVSALVEPVSLLDYRPVRRRNGCKRGRFKIASTLLILWSVFVHFLQLQTYQTYLDDRSASLLITWSSEKAHMETGWLNVIFEEELLVSPPVL